MKTTHIIVEHSKRELMKAIRLFCSAKVLAEKIGVSKQRVNYWKSSEVLMPYDVAVKIFVVTDAQVDIHELRPDLVNLTKEYENLLIKKYIEHKTRYLSGNLR